MCEFISWIPRKKGNYFLTYHQVFETEKGQLLLNELKGDWYGHSGIRFYYDLPQPSPESTRKEMQCTDFSSPVNFPEDIAQAIKNGEMGGCLSPNLLAMLSKRGRKEYSIECKAHAEWDKARAELDKARAEWDKARAELDKAHAELDKADEHGKIFWRVFANPPNRIKAWRYSSQNKGGIKNTRR